ncbi:MAG TPA: urease accessory protein UreD [Candidatus Baltobacteraceae bacterium]
MTSLLGPGAIRDDHFHAHGVVESDAHLLVTAQAATRLLGGSSSALSSWRVAAGAFLEIVNEPLVPSGGAVCELRTTIDLAPTARVALLDVVSFSPAVPCRLRSQTLISLGGRAIAHDHFAITRERDEESCAVGTYVFCDPSNRVSLEPLAAKLSGFERPDVRVGAGSLRGGGVLVRVLGPGPWAVRAALHGVRAVILKAAELPAASPRGSL